MDQLRNMECVKTDLGLGKLFPRPRLEGFGHVHRDELDLVRLTLVALKIGLSAFGGADHSTGERVMKNREVPESASDIFLVDTQGPDFAIGGRLTGRLHMDIDGPPDAVLGDPKHLGNGRNRKFFSQGQNQGIHQEGKAASRTGPRHLHLGDLAALGALHPGQRRVQKGLELEKVKVLPSPLSPIMNRLITRSANWAPQSFGITSEIKVDLSLFRLETNLIDLPRILKAQRCGEEGRLDRYRQ